jgi:hypothetical protein
LTFTNTLAALTIDGVAVAANDRVLVKNQSALGGVTATANTAHNGIYTVTATGSTTVPWSLTRAADADTAVKLSGAAVIATLGAQGSRRYVSNAKDTDTLNTTTMSWSRLVESNASGLVSVNSGVGVDLQLNNTSATVLGGNVTDYAAVAIFNAGIIATSASTYTRASTLYIAGSPQAITNTTITSGFAAYIAAGDVCVNSGLLLTGTSLSRVLSATAPMRLQVETADNNAGVSVTRNTADNAGGNYRFYKTRGATVNSNTIIQTGDSLGHLTWFGADGTGPVPAAEIRVEVDNTPGVNDMPGRMIFSTTSDGGSSPTERMRLDMSGALLINTTINSTVSKLVVSSTASGTFTGNATLYNTGTASSSGAQLDFYANTNSTSAAQLAAIVGAATNTTGAGELRFYTSSAAGSTANRLTITSAGDVLAVVGGIGYGTGSGGATTQLTSRTTGVTLNKTNGAITLVSAAGTATWQSFTVTNSTVAATDVVKVCQKSGTDLYMIHVTAVAAGSFRISFATTGGTTTETPVFNFAVIKAVVA